MIRSSPQRRRDERGDDRGRADLRDASSDPAEGTPEKSGRLGIGGFFRAFIDKMPWHESIVREESMTVPAPRGRAISIHNANGKTRVIGEDRKDIEIRVVKKVSADCPEHAEKILDSIEIQRTRTGQILEIEVHVPRKCSRRAVAHVELRVPRATKVASTSTNGKICLEGLERSIRARSSNGAIMICEVNGDIDVTTANARVKCICTNGKLHARSSNGKIEVGRHTGSLDASTSNGVIKAALEALGKEGVSLSTSNGRIVLELPDESNADVDIRVENGQIRNDIHLENPDSPTEGRVRGRIGTGGTPIRLRTSNGTIALREG